MINPVTTQKPICLILIPSVDIHMKMRQTAACKLTLSRSRYVEEVGFCGMLLGVYEMEVPQRSPASPIPSVVLPVAAYPLPAATARKFLIPTPVNRVNR
jgi:hypothetical protein